MKQKWFTLKEKFPKLNTYVLLYVNRPWVDDQDDPKYVVAKFTINRNDCEHQKYRFEQFGPDCFSLDDVLYWSYIDKIENRQDSISSTAKKLNVNWNKKKSKAVVKFIKKLSDQSECGINKDIVFK